MAKLTALQLQNQVEANNGLPQSTSLTGLGVMALKIFNIINEAIFEIGIGDKWKPLETTETITLATGTTTYTRPTTCCDIDKESFIYDNQFRMFYRTPQEIDVKYPTKTDTGFEKDFFEYGGFWSLPRIPDTSVNAKTIKYRAWKFPTLLSTATATGTSWFPEGFDQTVLVNWATRKIMAYRNMEEYKDYEKKVMGDREFGVDGFLTMMRRNFRSPAGTKIQVGDIR